MSCSHIDKSSKLPCETSGCPRCNELNAKINADKASYLAPNSYNYKLEIMWTNVIIFVILHSLALYGLILIFTGQVGWKAILFNTVYALLSALGITAGVHRLWTHRSYKANLPLRIFLMLCQSATLQNDIYVWARDHRVHHKYTDTDADPHNVNRGFFFSHVGWLLCKKHKDVIEKGKTIDMSDVLADPVVQFQRRHYLKLIFLATLVIPMLVSCYLGESVWISFVLAVSKYVYTLHVTWSLNSVAHMFGSKPYNKHIKAVENVTLGVLCIGEGWHNFHHCFPWDYRTGEFGSYGSNLSAGFLDLMAKVGWATELKIASDDLIMKTSLKNGDGTWHSVIKENNNNLIGNKNVKINYSNHTWGWGDPDMKDEESNAIKILNS
ncbi:stearoyl-CoA desaturase 5-like [Sitophilus oryzae]|uniref:Stearoyl-CoA desaturase 5-like n=1 Tax=Sitophilus oryzae TaxID=7048 RepID=A0A6J2XK97_SITOR|nr:stearoyl-CoA desaturase 5-like [Sitophilus oryzae]